MVLRSLLKLLLAAQVLHSIFGVICEIHLPSHQYRFARASAGSSWNSRRVQRAKVHVGEPRPPVLNQGPSSIATATRNRHRRRFAELFGRSETKIETDNNNLMFCAAEWFRDYHHYLRLVVLRRKHFLIRARGRAALIGVSRRFA